MKRQREENNKAGFMLAPILYMLALAGVGAAVMFSGYSQVLRSNAEMTAINTVRQQLQAAGQTLSASSVLDTATSSIVQPPAVSLLASVTDSNRFPAIPSDTTPDASELGNYLTAAGSPNNYGVIDVNTGVRQLDPWGKYYVYCRWENPVSSPASPSIMILSAGPDSTLSTNCGATTALGDDRITKLTVAEAINRANVWQVTSSSQVKFGIDSDAVRVNQDGTLTAKSLTLSTPLGVQYGGTGANSAGGARANLSVPDLVGTGASGLWAISVTGNAGTATALETARAFSIAGSTGLSAAAASFNGTADVALTLTGTLALTNGGTGATSASGARTNLGAGTVGDLVFQSTTTDIAQGHLGATNTGKALFTTASAATARTTLGLGTMATQNANAVAITGGTITGADLTGSTIPGSGVSGSVGSASSVPASGITGIIAVTQGGTGANNAAAARTNLGTNDATNLTAGTLNTARLAVSGVTAGTYNWGTVDTYGRVTAANNVNTTAITEGDSGVSVSDTGTNGAVTITTNGAVRLTVDANGNVGIGTATPTEKLDVNGNIQVRGAAGTDRSLIFSTTGTPRWAITENNVAESGSNAGSNFVITRYSDAGASLGNALAISRSSGTVSVADLSASGAITATGGFYGTLYGSVSGSAGNLTISDGTAAAPGLPFTNDLNTGIYRAAVDVFGISAGGRAVATFTGNTSGVNYVNITASATGTGPAIAAAGTDTNINLNLNALGTGSVVVTSQAAGAKGLIVKGAASQTGNLLELQDSAGTALASFASNGDFTLESDGVANGASRSLYFKGTGSPANTQTSRIYQDAYGTAGNQALRIEGVSGGGAAAFYDTELLLAGMNIRRASGALRMTTTDAAAGVTIGNSNDQTSGNILTVADSATHLVVDHAGKIGIGTATPAYKFDLRETKTETTGDSRMSYKAMTVNAASASDAYYYGDYVLTSIAGTTNQTGGVRGIYSYVSNGNTATASNTQAVDALVQNNSTGTMTNAVGVNGSVNQGATTGTIANAIGLLGAANSYKVSGIGIANANGGQLQAVNSAAGTITNASGSYNIVQNVSTGLITTATATNATIGNLSTGTITTAVGLRSGISNATGGTIGAWYGIYVDAANNSGTITNKYPLYIADTGNSYFAGAVGIGSASPNASSLLDIASTTKGALFPRMTTTQRDAIVSPATGLLVYNSTTNLFNVFNGTAWTIVGNDGNTAFSFPAGTVTAPGLYVTGDPDTGFYQSAANKLSVTAGGVEVMRWNTATTGVNYIDVTAAAAGAGPIIAAAGADTNINLILSPKGTGKVGIGTSTVSSLLTLPGNNSITFAGFSAQNQPFTIGTDSSDSAVLNFGGGSGKSFFIQSSSSNVLQLSAASNGHNMTGRLTITSALASQNSLIVKGFASQTAPLFEAQNSSGTALALIDASGNFSGAGFTTSGAVVAGAFSGAGSSITALNATNLATGTVAPARLGSGTPSTATFLRGDSSWAALDATAITADTLDFSQFVDNMTLDASTNIAASGTNVLSITNTGTGNSFVVNDETSDGTPFVIDASGNVGIGTNAPTTPLHIIDASYNGTGVMISAASAAEQADLQLDRAANQRAARIIYSLAGTKEWFSGILRNGGNAVTAYSISTNEDANIAVPQFLITTGGNVGIGSTSPAEKLDVVGDIRSTNSRTRSLTRTLPTAINDAVDIGTFTFTSGGSSLWVSVTVPSSGFSVAKQYVLPISYNEATSWTIAQPVSDTGAYSTNDFELDVQVNAGTASLRLRRTGGSTAGTAYVLIKQEGLNTDAFTASTATATVTAPTAFYNPTVIRQVDGNVGIGTSAPSVALDVNGAIAALGTVTGTGGLRLGASTNLQAGSWGTVAFGSGGPGGQSITFNGFNDGITFNNNANFGINGAKLLGYSSGSYIQFNNTAGANSTPALLLVGSQGNDPGNPIVRVWDPSAYTQHAIFGVGGGTTYSEYFSVNGSGSVGIGTATPNASALLDVFSTTKGFLPPRMTTTQVNAITSPANGLFVYDSTVGRYKAYQGGAWQEVLTSATGNITADSLDFDKFADNMTLDASTNIAASGTNVLSITNTGTGNSFVVNDETSDLTNFVVDAGGNVGIGTNVPGSKLDVRETKTDTAATALYMSYKSLTLNPATDSSSTFYSDTNIATTSGTKNTSTVVASRNGLYHGSTGVLATGYGAYNSIAPTSTGVITSATGTYSTADNVAGTSITSAYGAISKATNANTTGVGVANAYGMYGSAENTAAGTMTNAYGSYNYILNSAAGAITTSYGAMSRIDNNAAGSLGTTYGYYTYLNNAGGGTVSNWYGVYVAPVTGTAPTTARYPLYIADTGNSYFAGKVGIGTATPSTPLDVYGANGSVMSVRSPGGSYDFYVDASLAQIGTAKALGFSTLAAQPMTFSTNLTEVIRITSSGTVGVGTSVPATTALLDVASTTKGFLPPRMTSVQRDAIATPATGLNVYNTTTNKMNVYNGTSWSVVGGSAHGSNGFVQFTLSGELNSDSNFFWDNANKRLGIASGTPAYPVDVVGRTRSSTFIHTAVAGAAAPTQASGASGGWSVAGNNVYKLLGNVGIGNSTLTTGASLDMISRNDSMTLPSGTTAQRPATGVASMTRYNTTTNMAEYFNGTAWVSLQALTPAGSTTQIQYNNAGAFAGSAALIWDNANSRLGIGTASPVTPLQVAGDISSTANSGSFRTWGMPNSSNTTLVLQGGAASGSGGNIELGSGGGNVYDASLHAFRSLDGSSTFVNINSSGLGVGLTPKTNTTSNIQSPGDITLSNAGSANALLFNSYYGSSAWRAYSTGFGGGIRHDNATGQLQFMTATASASADAVSNMTFNMVINANGNVGIGSATPNSKLDVAGTVTATLFSGSGASLTALNATNLATGTVGTARLGTGTADGTTYLRGDGTWATPSGTISGSGTANYVTKFTGSTAIGNSIIFDNGTNVGIGTNLPLRKLEINNTLRFSNSSADQNDGVLGTATFVPGLNIVGINTDGVGRKIAYWGALQQQSSDTSYFQGSLGIGSNTPTTKLDVNGSAKVTTLAVHGSAGNDIFTIKPADDSNPTYNAIVLGNAAWTAWPFVVSKTGAVTAASFSGSGASLTALNATNLATGTVGTARLGTGTASSSTYLRGDGTWATPSGGDNLGSHTATTTLSMANYMLQNVGQITTGTWNATYDTWIQGGVNGATGAARNLAILGTDNDSGDTLYVNHSSEYAGGTIVGGPVTLGTSSSSPIYYDQNNAAFYVDPASTSVTNDMRANIFYDRGNTGYYVDPASTSNLNTLNTGAISCIQGTCPANNAVRMTPNLHLNSGAAHAVILNWDNGTTGTAQTLRVGNGAGADVFYVRADGVTYGASFYDINDGNYYINPASISVTNDMRANIFYDRGNTGYYVDPNSNSRMANGYFDSALINWPGYNGITQAYGHYMWPGRLDGSGASWQQSWYLASHSSYGLYTNTGIYISGTSFAPFIYDQQNTAYYWDGNGTTSMNVVYAYNYYHHSDERLKKDIVTVPNALEMVGKLRGVHYAWKNDGKKAYGVIAQEVQKVMPDAVQNGVSEFFGVEYDQLFGPIIEAIKELKALFDGLAAKVETLFARAESADKEITALKQENESLKKRLELLEKAILEKH